MNDQFKDIQRQWEKGKEDLTKTPFQIEEHLLKVSAYKRKSLQYHYGNILAMLFILCGISLFFYYVAPVEWGMSRTGVALMVFGVSFRMLAEIISVIRSRKIDPLKNTLEYTNSSIEFSRFRKFIHVTITLVAGMAYTIGFYLLTPEFNVYFDSLLLLLIDVSYFVLAIVIALQIRRGVRKEMKILAAMNQLKKDITESENTL